jgi:glucokinase
MEGHNLVVDLGGTRVRVALAGTDLHLHERREERTIHDRAAAGVIDQIVRLAEESLAAAGRTWSDIGCMGVASPGPLDPATGIVYTPPNMPGWGEVPLGPELSGRTGVPVVLINDANAAALGEFHAGAGQGTRNLVYLTISTGIGGGVIVEGSLMEGSSGSAAELGHHTVDRHGPPCHCGSIGCLEAISSGSSIALRFRQALAAGGGSILADRPAEDITAADIARAAAEGDALASEVWADSMQALGFGVVNSIHIFNPDVIVLGGGVTKAGPQLFDPVMQIVDRYALAVPRAAVRIVPAALGEDAGLTGAAAAARSSRMPRHGW